MGIWKIVNVATAVITLEPTSEVIITNVGFATTVVDKRKLLVVLTEELVEIFLIEETKEGQANKPKGIKDILDII